MMKQHITYERRRIGRKQSEQDEAAASAEAAAEIGSRVFPLPTPAAATMLTVARKSSTRVFVPRKTIAGKKPEKVNYFTGFLQPETRYSLPELAEKAGDSDSGKLDATRCWNTNENGCSSLIDRVVPESNWTKMNAQKVQGVEKLFDKFYSRKRPRISSISLDSSSSTCGNEANDLRFGVVFSRKLKKSNPEMMNDQFIKIDTGWFIAGARHNRLQIGEFTRNFMETNDISKNELWTTFNDTLLLVVLLESPGDDTILRFRRFLISVFSWMRKARMSLHHFTKFLLSEPMSSTFPRHGIHFLPLADRNGKSSFQSYISNFGMCKIYSTRESLPLIFLNFRALPSYFLSLHFAYSLGFQYVPHSLLTYLMDLNKELIQDMQFDNRISHNPADTKFSQISLSVCATPVINRNASGIDETSAVVAQSSGIVRSSKLRKLQKRRSFFRQSRSHKISSVNCRNRLRSSENGALSLGGTLRVRHLETLDGTFNSFRNKVISTSPGSLSKHMDSPESHLKPMEICKKSHSEQMKEIKAALSDIKQNIDSVQCNTNILVTAGDKCWREGGAEVMLELSNAGDWCLAIKIGRDLRYLHRPQDLRYTLNRFTHSYVWIGEDGWRLEFSEKWDWLTFKELHAECRQRNKHPKEEVSVKVIPIPVFNEVSFCADDRTSSFERPEQYIRMNHDDEILRATVSEVPYYDMDSGDDEWLKQHNSSKSIIQNGTSYILEEAFERMIFTFEKNAYYSSNAMSFEKELDNHEELRATDMVADVYDYWLKKRKQKRAPLVRVFQGISLRKPQLMQRQVFRKRRSLKRLRSQVERGKPISLFDSKAKEEARADALLRVEEAENAWRCSEEAAVPLRRRAQLLMQNADLAAYKSVMALRISEAIGSLPAEDALSSFFDYLPEI